MLMKSALLTTQPGQPGKILFVISSHTDLGNCDGVVIEYRTLEQEQGWRSINTKVSYDSYPILK